MQELRWFDKVETVTRPGTALMVVTLKDTIAAGGRSERVLSAPQEAAGSGSALAQRRAGAVCERRVLGRVIQPVRAASPWFATAPADSRGRESTQPATASPRRQEGQYSGRAKRAYFLSIWTKPSCTTCSSTLNRFWKPCPSAAP